MPKVTDEDRLTRIIHRTLTSPKLAGELVCYTGTSQYASQGAGSAACGLAALNFARVVLDLAQDRVPGTSDSSQFLKSVLCRGSIEEAIAICERWTGNAHMEVEDILGMPILDRSMKMLATKYGTPGFDEFKSVLSLMVDLEGSAAAIITRPPEILSCIKLALSKTLNIFIIFDSHPRQRYPDGTGLLVFASVEGTARALTELLPVVELSESGLQWQAQLLSNYSAHILVPRPVHDRQVHFKHIAMDSSLEILALRERTRQTDRLLQENERLECRAEELEQQLRRERAKGKRAELQSRSESASRNASDRPEGRPMDVSKSASTSKLSHTTSTARRTRSTPSGSGTVHLPAEKANTTPTLNAEIYSQPIDGDDKALHDAFELQRTYDQEDRRLRRQFIELAKDVQSTFRCEVCFDELPEDVVMRVDGCGHGFCRDCIRGHVQNKLQEHRYPIICPVCAASNDGDRKPCVITEDLIHFVELTPEQFNVWTEMQLSQFSTLLHCRKCKISAWVDKHDVAEATILVCPLRGCGYAYCKDCSQAVEIDGPKHSCDGSAELDHLMRQRGWKYCPTCHTPIQKDSGCNHMTCMSPACNTHFCYLCGESIIQSAHPQRLREAVSRHYTRCQLFEIPGNAA
ncbi:hypothetical protein PENSPDRAFT_604622 [Peniophora sp. CONT]|nr:hypothetical protein PENSPDRAFT_604622 [Peniophora sp. CONT]